jgi:uncharacterized membrane protein YvlD (DUF360 family)
MIRLLLRAAISLVTVAVALLICLWVLPGFSIGFAGFIVAVIVFAIAQAILAPLILKIVTRHAEALVGGIGLISTFVALLIASLFPSGVHLSGISTWLLATLIIWVVTALGGWLLASLIFKKKTNEARGR